MLSKGGITHDFVAKIRLLPVGSGGRSLPVHSGWRIALDLGAIAILDNRETPMVNDCTMEFEDADSYEPGSVFMAFVWMMCPEFQMGRLFVSMEFRVLEGSHHIGDGTIQDVNNPQMLK